MVDSNIFLTFVVWERSQLKTKRLIQLKKYLKSFPKKKISSSNDRLRGSFKITTYRKYEFKEEVDVEFKGEIFAKYNTEDSQWFKSDIYSNEDISTIKVNKLIKNSIFDEVKTQCSYFGINLKYVNSIKKIKWS